MPAEQKTEEKGSRVEHMLTAPIPKLVRELSLPTMVSMLVTSFYNLVDTAFVGRIDTQATAAVGVSMAVMSLIQAFSFLFGHGSGNYMSRRFGAGDYEDARRMAATGFFSALIVGAFFCVSGLLFVRPIAILLGSTDTILPYAVSYLRIIFLGTPFIMGAFVLNNHMRYQGEAFFSMIGIVSGAVLNIGLDPLFIFVFKWGVAGAALATALSQVVSFGILLALNLRRAEVPVNFRYFTPCLHYYKNILRGGLPSLFRQGMASLSAIFLNRAAGAYGGDLADAAIAAMGVVTRITHFAYAALLGFGQGFQPICGTNYGAGKFRRVREALFYCMKLGGITLAVLSALGFITAPGLVALFRKDPDVIRIGAYALRAQCIFFPLNAYITLANMMLQTTGMIGRASIGTLARQGICLIPLILILPLFLGLRGVQIAQAGADLLTFFLVLPLTVGVIGRFREDADPSEAAKRDMA
ncbi:MAG: MATE family efflux transporter [Lachnospiraceae bacterium]|nr:MATE family efflux transporter [Lachnospiraceae bacterium]